MLARFASWIHRNMPTREQMERSRWIRPFAGRVLRSELWRFTRRSVPRGVALGLLVGIFVLVPGLQIVGTALLSLPVRANIPLGAAMTFLSNPATTPFILLASVYIGNAILDIGADAAKVSFLMDSGASIGDWVAWFFSEAAPAMLLGLFIVAVVSAALGYVAAALGWRWMLLRKWKRRGHGRLPGTRR